MAVLTRNLKSTALCFQAETRLKFYVRRNKNQQSEIRKALDKQIQEKKRLKDEEKRKQMEQDMKELQRIQSENTQEAIQSPMWSPDAHFKAKRPKKLDPQFIQTQAQLDLVNNSSIPINNSIKDTTYFNTDAEEYKETPSLMDIKAGDLPSVPNDESCQNSKFNGENHDQEVKVIALK